MSDYVALGYQMARRALRHGAPRGAWCYRSGCSHPECLAANSAAMRARREHEQSLRALVDGRWVRTDLPAELHGERVTYAYRGCRCVACTEANTDYAVRRYAQMQHTDPALALARRRGEI